MIVVLERNSTSTLWKVDKLIQNKVSYHIAFNKNTNLLRYSYNKIQHISINFISYC
jgi:hypothetical protein